MPAFVAGISSPLGNAPGLGWLSSFTSANTCALLPNSRLASFTGNVCVCWRPTPGGSSEVSTYCQARPWPVTSAKSTWLVRHSTAPVVESTTERSSSVEEACALTCQASWVPRASPNSTSVALSPFA